MTTKTETLQTRNLHNADAKPEGSVEAGGATAEAAASAYAALQQALGEIGEQLERHQHSAAEQLAGLQKRLAELSEQMQQAESQLQTKLAELEQARIAAERSAAEARERAKASPSAPAPDDAEPPAVPDGKVAEAPVAQTPPPVGTSDAAATPPAPSPHAAQPAPVAKPVAARPVRQAIPAPHAARSHRDDGALERVVFGASLADDMSLAADRASLMQGLEGNDATAVGLVGQLMIFSAASAERMPQLLKDVGEAYYAWRPQAGDDPFRDALIAHLTECCEAAGVSNTIELVRPGDRYDHTRHNSKQRGVEIDGVFGWIVLRDNGKVYTKASVAVK